MLIQQNSSYFKTDNIYPFKLTITVFLINCILIQSKSSNQSNFNDIVNSRNLSLQSIVENQEQEGCQYCSLCQEGYCDQCQDGFRLDENSICISICEEGMYFDINNSKSCKPHCGHFYEYEDDQRRLCKSVRDCSLIMEIGQEYPDQMQDHHIIDQDLKIMISADYYSINLFDLSSGVQISYIPQTQGIRQLVYDEQQKDLYVLKVNGDVLLYNMIQIKLTKSYVKRKNEKNEKIKQKSILLLDQGVILMFGIERNIYLFNFYNQIIEQEFTTGRYTEILMFNYFQMPKIEKMKNDQSIAKEDESIDLEFGEKYQPLYFTIETDQKLNYFISLLHDSDNPQIYNLLNESKLIKSEVFLKIRLLILEETILYTFSAYSRDFPSVSQYRANKSNQEIFSQFIISQDQLNIFLIDTFNNIHILSSSLQLLQLVNLQLVSPILLLYAFHEKYFILFDQSNELSAYKQFPQSTNNSFLKTSDLKVNLQQTSKIYVEKNSSNIYLIGDGVIQIQEVNSSGIFARLEITNQISQNINFNYNITTEETDISLNELNQFIFHYDTSNITAYPFINIYDFVQRSYIKSLSLSQYILLDMKEVQKIQYVFQIQFYTIIILNNQYVITYDNMLLQVVDSFNFSEQNNNNQYTQALPLSNRQSIVFYNLNFAVLYKLDKFGVENYKLIKGKSFSVEDIEKETFQIQLILQAKLNNSLVLFNEKQISAKIIKIESMTEVDEQKLYDTPSKIISAKFNSQEKILLISHQSGDLIFYEVEKNKITPYKDESTQIKEFWFLEDNVVMVISQPKQISNKNQKGRINSTIFFWVLETDTNGTITIKSFESFNSRMTKQIYYSEYVQLLYGMDDCEGCNYIEQLKIFQNFKNDGSVSPYRVEQHYTDNLDSSHASTILYSPEFDKFIVNKIKSGVEINQNMNTNIYTQLSTNKHTQNISTVQINETYQLLFVHYQFIIEVWRLVDNSLLIDFSFQQEINKVVNSGDYSLIIATFKNSSEIVIWNYLEEKTWSYDFSIVIRDIWIQEKNLYIIFENQIFFDVCINFTKTKNCRRLEQHKKPINSFKIDSYGVIYTCSENQVISWEVLQNSLEYRVLQIYNTELNFTNINSFYIDIIYQRIFIQSSTTLVAFNFQEKTLQVITKLEDESSQGLEFGDQIIVKWSKNYFRIFDRSSLQFLEKQVYDQIVQVVVLNQPKIITVLLGQDSANQGQVMKFNYEQFFNLRSIEGDLFIGKINLKKIWYDIDSNRVIGIEKNGYIIFWEQENGRKEIREDQIVRITDQFDGKDIVLTDLLFDNIHNNIIAHDGKKIYNFEGSNYWSRGGLYTHLPDLELSSTDNQDSERDPEYEKTYIFDKTLNEFTFINGSNNIVKIKENKQYFIGKSSFFYRKFLQISKNKIVAYDQDGLYLLDKEDQSFILDSHMNQNILSCKQNDYKIFSDLSQSSFIVCFNRQKQVIQYLFRCQSQRSCKIIPQVIYEHPAMRIMELKLIYPFILTYDLSGLVYIYQLDIAKSYEEEKAKFQMIEKHQLLNVVQQCVINYKIGQIQIQSKYEVLIVNILNSNIKSFYFKKNYDIQFAYSDPKFNRLFIQQKNIKTLNVYTFQALNQVQEQLELKIQLSSLHGNGIINNEKHILIYSDFQINLYNRQTLEMLDYYKNPRQSRYINTIKIINDEIFLTIERFGIRIFYITSADVDNRTYIKLFTVLQIDSPLLISRSYENNIINLLGLSRSSFFNYTLTADQSSICKFAFPPIENNYQLLYYTNKLDQTAKSKMLFSSNLNSPKQYNFLVNFLPTQSNSELSYIDEFKTLFSDTSIAYQSSSKESLLILNPELFMRYSQKTLILQNVVLLLETDEDIKSDKQFIIKFNSEIKRIQFYNITIQGQNGLKNMQIVFQNMERIFIKNLTIENTFLINTHVFNFTDCETVDLQNIQISNISAAKSSTFITALNIQTKLSLDKISLSNVTTNQKLFQLSMLNSLDLKNLYISQVQFHIQEQQMLLDVVSPQFIFQIEAVSAKALIENLDAYYVTGIGSIQYTNAYQGEKQKSIVYQENIIVSNIKLQNFLSKISNSFFAITGNNISITQFHTYNLTCYSCRGTSLQLNNYENTIIRDSSFVQSTGYIGGALYLNPALDIFRSQVYLLNSFFKLNEASQFGGAIFTNNYDFQNFKNITFHSNSAPIGGAFRYYSAVKPAFPEDFHKEISFFNNSAEIFGDNYGSYPYRINIETVLQSEDNYFIKEIKVEDILNEVSQQKIQKIAQAFHVTNFRSGALLNLNITIYDENSQLIRIPQNMEGYGSEILKEFEDYELQFSSSNYNIVIDKKLSYSLLQSVQVLSPDETKQQYFSYHLIQDTAVIGQPINSDYIYIQVPFLKSYFFFSKSEDLNDNHYIIPKLVIKVNLRNCEQGEVLQKSNQFTIICHKCDENSYSLTTYDHVISFDQLLKNYDQQKCQRCPYYAESCKINQIILKDQYWRATNISDEIIFCENKPENCISKNEEYQYCKEGNIGPLCEECDINGVVWGASYTSSSDYNCTQCSGNSNPVVKYIFLYLDFNNSNLKQIGILIYLAFSLLFFLQIYIQTAKTYYLRQIGIISLGNSSLNHRSSIFAKQMLHYFQLMSVLQVLDYQIPFSVNFIPSSLGSPIQSMNGASDCIFRISNMPQVYVRVILSLIIPIIFKCIVYFFIRVLLRWMQIQIKQHKLQMVIIFSIIFFQPNVVNYFISVISCRKIGQQSYMNADLTQICYKEEHLKYTYFLVLPSLIIWVFFPLFILKGLVNCKNKLNFITTQYKYGFLYMEYKERCYYWEFVRLYVKLLIFLIINMMKSQPNICYAFIASFLIIYAYYVLKLNPFQNNFLNRLDFHTIVVLLVCIFCNVIHKNSTNVVIKDIASISQIIISYCFLFLLAFYMVKMKIKELKKHLLKSIARWKVKYPNLIPECFKKINLDDSTMRVNINWLRFKKKVYRSLAIKKNLETLNEIQSQHNIPEQNNSKENQQVEQNLIKQSCKVAMKMKSLDVFLQADKIIPTSLLNVTSLDKYRRQDKTLNKISENLVTTKDRKISKENGEIELNVETTSSRAIQNFRKKSSLIPIDINKLNNSSTIKFNQLFSEMNISTPAHFNNQIEDSPFDRTAAPFPLINHEEISSLSRARFNNRKQFTKQLEELPHTVSKQLKDQDINVILEQIDSKDFRSNSLKSVEMSSSVKGIDETSNSNSVRVKQTNVTQSSIKQSVPLFASIKNIFQKYKQPN